MCERGDGMAHGRGVFYRDSKGNIGFYSWTALSLGFGVLFAAIGSLG